MGAGIGLVCVCVCVCVCVFVGVCACEGIPAAVGRVKVPPFQLFLISQMSRELNIRVTDHL